MGIWRQRSDQILILEITDEWRVRDYRDPCPWGPFLPQEGKDQDRVHGMMRGTHSRNSGEAETAYLMSVWA